MIIKIDYSNPKHSTYYKVDAKNKLYYQDNTWSGLTLTQSQLSNIKSGNTIVFDGGKASLTDRFMSGGSTMEKRTKLGLSRDKMYKALGEGERTSKKVSTIRMPDGSSFKRRNANQYGMAEGGNDYTEKRPNRSDKFDNGGGTGVSSQTGYAEGTNAELLMNKNYLAYKNGGGVGDIKIVKIKNLEVLNEDFGKMTYNEALEKVKKLGGNWRLPSIEDFFNNSEASGLNQNRRKLTSIAVNESGDIGKTWAMDKEVNKGKEARYLYIGKNGMSTAANKNEKHTLLIVRDTTAKDKMEDGGGVGDIKIDVDGFEGVIDEKNKTLTVFYNEDGWSNSKSYEKDLKAAAKNKDDRMADNIDNALEKYEYVVDFNRNHVLDWPTDSITYHIIEKGKMKNGGGVGNLIAKNIEVIDKFNGKTYKIDKLVAGRTDMPKNAEMYYDVYTIDKGGYNLYRTPTGIIYAKPVKFENGGGLSNVPESFPSNDAVSYKNGGGANGYKLTLKNWDADIYEDSYEEGEGERVNSFGEKVNKSFSSGEELLEYINDNILYHNAKKEHYNIMDDGRIVTSVLVDEDNSAASENEIEKWKKGDKKLYSANYNFYITLTQEKTPSADELSKLLGISVYKKGGKLSRYANGGSTKGFEYTIGGL